MKVFGDAHHVVVGDACFMFSIDMPLAVQLIDGWTLSKSPCAAYNSSSTHHLSINFILLFFKLKNVSF